MYKEFVRFVRELYKTNDFIPLHAPQFQGNEKKYLLEVIDSTFVSSVGEFVSQFEQSIADFTGVKYAIAAVNGTSALHVALKLVGVDRGSEVLTQSLTFIATCNAVRYCGAIPQFIDVDINTLGLCPESLESFLQEFCEVRDDGRCWNKSTGRKISACVPMHTFGCPVKLDQIKSVCDQYNIPLVEDSAESLGSFYNGRHTGTVGAVSAVSLNGNKIITTGGGGVILTNDEVLAVNAKHLTTTAKVHHKWEFVHDEVGYNYRMPNLNAALGLAQMEQLPLYLKRKRQIAAEYQDWGGRHGMHFFVEPKGARANYWLNSLFLDGRSQRDEWLEKTNTDGVMTRPVWTPMHQLKINSDCQKVSLPKTDYLSDCLVNVPSSVVF